MPEKLTLQDVLADGRSYPVVSELHLARLHQEAVFEISDLPEEPDGMQLDHSEAGRHEVTFVPHDYIRTRDHMRLIGRIATLGKNVRVQLFIKDGSAYLRNLSAADATNSPDV